MTASHPIPTEKLTSQIFILDVFKVEKVKTEIIYLARYLTFKRMSKEKENFQAFTRGKQTGDETEIFGATVSND